MPDFDIYQHSQQFRDALLQRERAASVRLVKVYAPIWTRLEKRLAALSRQIEIARERGEDVNASWLARQERYQALLEQVAKEISRFADTAGDVITDQQQAAVRAALKDSEALIGDAIAQTPSVSGTFNKLPASAVESLAGFLGDGSPLRSLLGQFGVNARRKIEEELLAGIGLGISPRATARKIRDALGGNLARALLISRTETLRAYREASHRTRQQNADLIDGWYWTAVKGPRTCAACLSLDGTFHTADERMASHPNCRCVATPAIVGVPPPPSTRGVDWFADQPAEVQRRILRSQAAYEAYREGRLRLQDFVGLRVDPRWGRSYFQLGVGRALNNEGRFPGDAARPERVAPTAPPAQTPIDDALQPSQPARQSAADARQKLSEVEAQYGGPAMQARREYEVAANAEAQAAIDQSREYQGASYYEWRKRRLELQQKEIIARAEFNEKAREVLYQDSSAKFKVKNRKLNLQWEQGIDSFRRLIGEGLIDGEQVSFKKIKGRANYRSGANEVRAAATDGAGVIVHELGHWLEDKNRDIFDAVSAFLVRRTQGEKAQRLSNFKRGFRRDEITKPDQFDDPYVGKIYERRNGERYASEVVSMGLQYFYERPAEFAQTDPDYFDFIYDLVRRGKP